VIGLLNLGSVRAGDAGRPAAAQIPVLMLFVTRSGYFAAAASGRGAGRRWPA